MLDTLVSPLIQALEAEVVRLTGLVASLKDLKTNDHLTLTAQSRARRGWSPERRKKFYATLEKKKKAGAQKKASAKKQIEAA